MKEERPFISYSFIRVPVMEYRCIHSILHRKHHISMRKQGKCVLFVYNWSLLLSGMQVYRSVGNPYTCIYKIDGYLTGTVPEIHKFLIPDEK